MRRLIASEVIPLRREPASSGLPYEEQVRGYLADCAKAAAELQARGSALDAKHHPTPDGCVKFVPHRGDAREAAKIRAAYAEVTGGES